MKPINWNDALLVVAIAAVVGVTATKMGSCELQRFENAGKRETACIQAYTKCVEHHEEVACGRTLEDCLR